MLLQILKGYYYCALRLLQVYIEYVLLGELQVQISMPHDIKIFTHEANELLTKRELEIFLYPVFILIFKTFYAWF